MNLKHSPTQALGAKAERLACRYLKKQGLKLITQNLFTPFGELDLVMNHSNTLVFVEVRSRKKNIYSRSVETIDFNKQNRIIRSAQYYLQRHASPYPCRFDVVAVEANENQFEINWIKDAFQVE